MGGVKLFRQIMNRSAGLQPAFGIARLKIRSQTGTWVPGFKSRILGWENSHPRTPSSTKIRINRELESTTETSNAQTKINCSIP